MSRKPRIFVSAVASELRALRLDVSDLLSGLGFEPVLSDVTEGDSRDRRPQLRETIDGCDALLQIAGEACGPEPPTIDPDFGRVSYAQFEYLYAYQQRKKTRVILTQPGFAEDASRDGSAAVSDQAASVESESDRVERGKLQEAYRVRLQKSGHVWCEVADETELELAIERLADERASLRRPFRPWRRIGRRHAAAYLLVAAIGGVSWLAVRWHNDKVVARALASIDTTRMRAQLEKSIGEAWQRDVSRANQLGEPQQRQNALREAERRRDEKRADLDGVLEVVTGTIVSGQASPEFLEMSHILQEEGVDAALACLSRHETQLLTQARAAAAKRERGLGRTLTPLLEGVPLLRDRGDLAEAERLCETILSAEPDWPPAQRQRVVTMMQSGERLLAENRPMAAWQRFAAARTSADQVLKRDPRNRLCQAQLPKAYLELGELTYKSNHWPEANELVDRGLAVAKQRADADPSDLEAQRALLEMYGKTAEFRLRILHLGEAAQVFQPAYALAGALAAASAADEAAQRDLADWYERIGRAFQLSGRAKPEAYRASVEIRTRLAAARPQDVQRQRQLAAAYENLGSMEIGVSPFFLKSLEIRKRLAADAPHVTEFQHDLAVLYDKMGTQAADRPNRIPFAQSAVWINQAREFYGRDLEILERLAAPSPDDRAAQHELAVCYEKLAELGRRSNRKEEACNSCNKQLEILTKLAAADPGNSEAQQELAAAYEKLGDLSWQAGHVDRTRDCLQHVFDIRSRLALATPPDPQAVFRLEQSCARLAWQFRSAGDLDAAEQVCQRGLTVLARLGETPVKKETGKAGTTNAILQELQACERAKIIRGPLDALLQQPARQLPSLLSNRIGLLAARRDIDGVAKTAETLAKLEPKDRRNLYLAACGYALCAKLASGWPGHGPFPPKGPAEKNTAKAEAQTHSAKQRYVRAAIELLQAAKKAGDKNVANARRDPDFAALRDESDFKKLVGGTP